MLILFGFGITAAVCSGVVVMLERHVHRTMERRRKRHELLHRAYAHYR